jgi:hypothetical protein
MKEEKYEKDMQELRRRNEDLEKALEQYAELLDSRTGVAQSNAVKQNTEELNMNGAKSSDNTDFITRSELKVTHDELLVSKRLNDERLDVMKGLQLENSNLQLKLQDTNARMKDSERHLQTSQDSYSKFASVSHEANDKLRKELSEVLKTNLGEGSA